MTPGVSEFVYITDDTYNKNQVIRMEHLILKVLSFDLSVPTPLTFINAICIAAKLNEKTMYLAMVSIFAFLFDFRVIQCIVWDKIFVPYKLPIFNCIFNNGICFND